MSLRPEERSPEVAPTSSEEVLAASLDVAFDEFDIADLLESHAELVLNLTETIERLEHALEARKVIGQALGICMERYHIREDQAFQFLVRISQNQNVKLRDVASHLVSSQR
jgi:AmiR/NasT family two-component response regulator